MSSLFAELRLICPDVWDLCSLTRDCTHVPCIARRILNFWTTREAPGGPSFAAEKVSRFLAGSSPRPTSFPLQSFHQAGLPEGAIQMGYPGQGQREGEGSGAVRDLTAGSSHLSQPCPFLWRDAVDNGPIRALIESLTHQPLAAANEGIQGITASIIKFDFWMWLCQQWALVRVFRKMWQSWGGVAHARGMAVPQRCSYRACFTWLHITSPEAAGALKTTASQRPACHSPRALQPS